MEFLESFAVHCMTITLICKLYTHSLKVSLFYYRPQTKVMFSQASVILFRVGDRYITCIME